MATKKILVVDDSPELREKLHELLATQSYEVVNAADGKEGLRKAKENPYDLIIADLNMPGLNGLEMLAEIRKDELNSKTHSFLLTTEPVQDHTEQFRAVGGATWIMKPYAPQVLLRSIELMFNEAG